MLWYLASVIKSSDPVPGLLTISDPELQNIVELFMKVVFKQLIKTNATVIYLEGVALVIEIFYWYVSTSLCTVTVGLAQLAGPSLRTRKEQILVWEHQRNQRISWQLICGCKTFSDGVV